MKLITHKLLDETSRKAKTNKRFRMNYNFHDSLDDAIHRMLNALEPETYVRPHKHENPEKQEIVLLLKGSLIIFIFDEDGSILEKIELSQASGNIGLEIPKRCWHSLLVLEKNTIIYEIKDGPYTPVQDKDFASWSPQDDDTEGVLEFMNNLRKSIL